MKKLTEILATFGFESDNSHVIASALDVRAQMDKGDNEAEWRDLAKQLATELAVTAIDAAIDDPAGMETNVLLCRAETRVAALWILHGYNTHGAESGLLDACPTIEAWEVILASHAESDEERARVAEVARRAWLAQICRSASHDTSVILRLAMEEVVTGVDTTTTEWGGDEVDEEDGAEVRVELTGVPRITFNIDGGDEVIATATVEGGRLSTALIDDAELTADPRFLRAVRDFLSWWHGPSRDYIKGTLFPYVSL
jgi:hypothetical protein